MKFRFRHSCLLSAAILAVALSTARTEDNPQPKTTTENVPTSVVPLELIRLPAGKITIKGADGKETAHDVKPIWISKTEITWDHYYPFSERRDLTPDEKARKVDAVNRPSEPWGVPHGNLGPEEYPAYRISELAARQFCAWLSKKTGKKYRLPTEAEWEYACRAGGDPVHLKVNELKPVAWFINNSNEEPQPVAKKKPNPWGLYDMLGNVAEWVIGADGVPVIKGGSYKDEAASVNSTIRQPFDPAWQRDDAQIPKGKSWYSNGEHVGFRVVRED